MENFNPCWERIDEIMWHYRFRKISEFARHLGLKRSENLYQIKCGNYRISFAMATLICEKFPQINKGWLLCGEGEMLKKGIEEYPEAIRPESVRI